MSPFKWTTAFFPVSKAAGAPTLKKGYRSTSTPLCAFRACYKMNFTFTFTIIHENLDLTFTDLKPQIIFLPKYSYIIVFIIKFH